MECTYSINSPVRGVAALVHVNQNTRIKQLKESGFKKGSVNFTDLSTGEYLVRVYNQYEEFLFNMGPAYVHDGLITIVPATVPSQNTLSTSTPLSSGMMVYCSVKAGPNYVACL